MVTVTPDDTGRDPVVGELVASSADEIIIRRSDSVVGEVCIHFPRRIRGCVSLTANAGAFKTLASVRSGPGHDE